MIDMRHKPHHLPQVNAPYKTVLEKLDEEGIQYSLIEITPSDDDGIEVSQGIVFNDNILNIEIKSDSPIYMSNDGVSKKIIDGHSRYVKGMIKSKPILAVEMEMNSSDASRALNKIQDIFEYEESANMEEVEVQDTVNYFANDEDQFLTSMDEDNDEVQLETPSLNSQTVFGYRVEEIKENSSIGNFFSLTPMKGGSKYEIEFTNLLDTGALGIVLKDSQQPVDILSKIWFPYINFEELAKKHGLTSIILKNKAIAEKAMKMGFDGIKYGDTLIQGLK
jgi:hypothetical protein